MGEGRTRKQISWHLSVPGTVLGTDPLVSVCEAPAKSLRVRKEPSHWSLVYMERSRIKRSWSSVLP